MLNKTQVNIAVSLITLPTQVCWEASVNLELEVTCRYYFGATKDQCRIFPGLTVPWATL